MNQNILQTQQIKDSILRMSDNGIMAAPRIILIELDRNNPPSSKEVVSFSTDNFDDFSYRAITAEGTIFKSLYSYYLIQQPFVNKTSESIPNQLIENAFHFLSNFELYHLEVGDAPWIDVSFYFKPIFFINHCPIPNLCLSDLNQGRANFVINLSLMDGQVNFYLESKVSKAKSVLINSERYAVEPDQVYFRISKCGRISATPKSITNTIINSL